jgi:hypothetical protein
VSTRLTALVVEDSEQDYLDVEAYLIAGFAAQGLTSDQDYIIERATNRPMAEHALDEHEQKKDALFAIFDIHIQEDHQDLTELIATLVDASMNTWRGMRPIIVYSQYAERVGGSGGFAREKKRKNLFFAISKSLRSNDDPRDRLRTAIAAAIEHLTGLGAQ